MSIAEKTEKNETTQTISKGLERKGREARIQKNKSPHGMIMVLCPLSLDFYFDINLKHSYSGLREDAV